MPFDDVIDDLRQALAGDVGAMGRIANGVAKAVGSVEPLPSAGDLVFDAWSDAVRQHAVGKWYNGGAAACVLGNKHACGAVAAGQCAVCHRPVCPMHAMVSYQADLLCLACVGMLIRASSESESARQSIAAAWKILGLDPSCSSAELDARIKELRKKHHPDRARGERAKAAAEAAYKAAGTAYDTVKGARKAGSAGSM